MSYAIGSRDIVKLIFVLGFVASCSEEISTYVPDTVDAGSLGIPSRGGLLPEVGTDASSSTPDVGLAAAADLGADVLVRSDLPVGPDVLVIRDTVPAVPDVTPPRPEVGKEAVFVCPATCFTGCYSGCGTDGQCKACLTCTCEGATGICHC